MWLFLLCFLDDKLIKIISINRQIRISSPIKDYDVSSPGFQSQNYWFCKQNCISFRRINLHEILVSWQQLGTFSSKLFLCSTFFSSSIFQSSNFYSPKSDNLCLHLSDPFFPHHCDLKRTKTLDVCNKCQHN